MKKGRDFKRKGKRKELEIEVFSWRLCFLAWLDLYNLKWHVSPVQEERQLLRLLNSSTEGEY